MFKETHQSLFVLFAFCLSGLALPAQALDDPALRTKITKLDNGLTVLLLEDHSTPVVAFQMWVGAGSRDEHRYTGIAHLFEHMMFKGSKHVGPEEHARRIEAHGGRVNAYTSRDRTVYHEDIPAQALPLVIALEAERVAHERVGSADSLNLPVLNHAQDLFLHAKGNGCEFVEYHRAAIGAFEVTDMRFLRTRKSAGLVSE